MEIDRLWVIHRIKLPAQCVARLREISADRSDVTQMILQRVPEGRHGDTAFGFGLLGLVCFGLAVSSLLFKMGKWRCLLCDNVY